MPWKIDVDKVEPDNNQVHSGLGWNEENDSDCTVRFKIKDDDGNLQYKGRMSPDMLEDESCFDPLNWATWNAGATEIWLFEDGKWNQL